MISITKELLHEWFKVANEKYFDGKIKVEPTYIVSNKRSFYGQYRVIGNTIEISTAFIRTKEEYINTFLHELCHLLVRQEYGKYAQAHGKEWKKVAMWISCKTKGKYGEITRVSKYCELRDKSLVEATKNKTYKFIAFTDYSGKFAVAKYSNEKYVLTLKRLGGISSNTKVYFFTSNKPMFADLALRKASEYSLHWSLPKKFTLQNILDSVPNVRVEIYK